MKKKVLVIDDETAFSDLVKINLENTGDYEAKTASKGSEVFEIVAAYMPDLIIMDIVLKDADGREVLSKIRSDANLARIPVIILSALPPEQISDRPSGSSDDILILSKPIALNLLIENINRQLKP